MDLSFFFFVKEFKKEQLRVQINNGGILKISGERSIDSWKKTKFYKEVEVPKNCNTNRIQAKFANGSLYVIMPKTTTSTTEQTKPKESEGSGTGDHKTKSDSIQDDNQIGKLSAPPPPAEDKEIAEKMLPSSDQVHRQMEKSVSRMKRCAKMSLNVAVAVAVMAALAAYVFYMYKSTLLED